MTGYPVAEVLGRNCRFLQGPDTDPAAVAEIRAALAEDRECVVEILNYRKDGTTFWNRLSITPVRESSGEVTHFIGVQSDVTARRRGRGRPAAVEGGDGAGPQAGGARAAGSAAPARRSRPAPCASPTRSIPCDDLAGDAVGIVPLPETGWGSTSWM